MAIEKTNLYDSTSTDNTFDNLYNYLLENAVPEYFDSIEKNDTGTYITCITNGWDIVKFPKTIGGSDTPIVKLANSTAITPSVRSGNYYGWAVKTKHGICLGTYSSSGYANPVFTICKDNENNTTLVFDSIKFANIQSYTYRIMAVNKNTAVSSYPNVEISVSPYSNNISEKTVLCPFMIGDTENHTPDVFYMPYAQNRSGGILTIDGVKYYSNGIWCVKEE